MSNLKRVLNEFNRLGYIVNNNGEVFSKDGRELKGCVVTYRGNTKYRKIGFRVFQFPSYSLKIHSIQAFKKFGDKIFEKDLEVRHLNGDSLDNSWENIGIGTHSQNMMDIPKEKRRKMSSHPIYDHKEVLKDRKLGMTYKEIMDKHGIKSKSTVSHIINKSLIACEA